MCCTQCTSKFGKLNGGHRTGKVSFHSNPKERQCQRMFKLLHNFTHFTCQQNNTQNSLSEASTVCEPRTSRCSRYRGTRGEIVNICWILEKTKEFQKNIYFCFIYYTKAFECMDHSELEYYEREGNTRPPHLLPKKPVSRSRSNSQNWTQNSGLFKIGEKCMTRLSIVTLFI